MSDIGATPPSTWQAPQRSRTIGKTCSLNVYFEVTGLCASPKLTASRMSTDVGATIPLQKISTTEGTEDTDVKTPLPIWFDPPCPLCPPWWRFTVFMDANVSGPLRSRRPQ